MASKQILRNYLETFEKDHRKICSLTFGAACPVIIKFCDASAEAKSFSESTVDFSINEGFPLACFQLIGQRKLLSYLEEKTDRSEAILRLEKFITNSKYFSFSFK